MPSHHRIALYELLKLLLENCLYPISGPGLRATLLRLGNVGKELRQQAKDIIVCWEKKGVGIINKPPNNPNRFARSSSLIHAENCKKSIGKSQRCQSTSKNKANTMTHQGKNIQSNRAPIQCLYHTKVSSQRNKQPILTHQLYHKTKTQVSIENYSHELCHASWLIALNHSIRTLMAAQSLVRSIATPIMRQAMKELRWRKIVDEIEDEFMTEDRIQQKQKHLMLTICFHKWSVLTTKASRQRYLQVKKLSNVEAADHFRRIKLLNTYFEHWGQYTLKLRTQREKIAIIAQKKHQARAIGIFNAFGIRCYEQRLIDLVGSNIIQKHKQSQLKSFFAALLCHSKRHKAMFIVPSNEINGSKIDANSLECRKKLIMYRANQLFIIPYMSQRSTRNSKAAVELQQYHTKAYSNLCGARAFNGLRLAAKQSKEKYQYLQKRHNHCCKTKLLSALSQNYKENNLLMALKQYLNQSKSKQLLVGRLLIKRQFKIIHASTERLIKITRQKAMMKLQNQCRDKKSRKIFIKARISYLAISRLLSRYKSLPEPAAICRFVAKTVEVRNVFRGQVSRLFQMVYLGRVEYKRVICAAESLHSSMLKRKVLNSFQNHPTVMATEATAAQLICNTTQRMQVRRIYNQIRLHSFARLSVMRMEALFNKLQLKQSVRLIQSLYQPIKAFRLRRQRRQLENSYNKIISILKVYMEQQNIIWDSLINKVERIRKYSGLKRLSRNHDSNRVLVQKVAELQEVNYKSQFRFLLSILKSQRLINLIGAQSQFRVAQKAIKDAVTEIITLKNKTNHPFRQLRKQRVLQSASKRLFPSMKSMMEQNIAIQRLNCYLNRNRKQGALKFYRQSICHGSIDWKCQCIRYSRINDVLLAFRDQSEETKKIKHVQKTKLKSIAIYLKTIIQQHNSINQSIQKFRTKRLQRVIRQFKHYTCQSRQQFQTACLKLQDRIENSKMAQCSNFINELRCQTVRRFKMDRVAALRYDKAGLLLIKKLKSHCDYAAKNFMAVVHRARQVKYIVYYNPWFKYDKYVYYNFPNQHKYQYFQLARLTFIAFEDYLQKHQQKENYTKIVALQNKKQVQSLRISQVIERFNGRLM